MDVRAKMPETVSLWADFSFLNIDIDIDIHMHMHTYAYICIYIYIQTGKKDALSG